MLNGYNFEYKTIKRTIKKSLYEYFTILLMHIIKKIFKKYI